MESLVGRVEERTPSIRVVKKETASGNCHGHFSSAWWEWERQKGRSQRTGEEGGGGWGGLGRGGSLTRSTTHLRDARPRALLFFLAFPSASLRRATRRDKQPRGRRVSGDGLFSFRVDGVCERVTRGLNILAGKSTCFAPAAGDGPLL